MRIALLALLLLIASACAKNSSPLDITSVQGCYSGWNGQETCQVTYADGDTGYLVKDYTQGVNYSCRRGGLY